MKTEKLYIKCTNDKYELPMVVTDSVPLMAKKLGIRKENIYKYALHDLHGYHRVIIEWEDGEQ